VGRAGDAVVIEVADRGAGIPELVRETARHGPLTERPEGMGVGLFLAYVAVEHHGGTLDFRPRPGGGTVARLAIPLRSARP
ncbi:sensor histidine kinase, partial [Aromatoleum petrolei]